MLIVTQRSRGMGLGRDLLGWAETYVAERGQPACRLDCARSNGRLRHWYEQAGYIHVGDKEFAEPSWARPVALYEKRLAGPERGTC
jgi:ribosomal protein S18 acetylase RimI-like enzyme